MVNPLKKIILTGSTAFMLSLGSLSHAAEGGLFNPVKNTNDYLSNIENYMKAMSDAQSGTGDYLQQIANNTYKTLIAVNNIPIYLMFITQMALSWSALDNQDGSPITASQESFAGMGYWLTQQDQMQKDLQIPVAADLLQFPPQYFRMPGLIASVIPNANDLSYATILGAPPVAMAGGTPYNYMKYAAALNHTHKFPVASWPGSDEAKARYANYYNTIMAIQSHDAYVLSSMVAESANGSAVASLQKSLTLQATGSSWIAKIATEELGKVIREILLYQSQSYVLLAEMLKTQKEMSATLAMTNSLLIVLSQPTTENQYLNAAMTPPQ